MVEVISSNKDLFDLIVQILIIVIPIVITWVIRTYVKGTRAERDVAAIMSLSNTAIDYVENLDKQGAFDELQLSPDFSKGLHKLSVGTDWLDAELRRNDIKMDKDDASKWVRAEFQKRIGDVSMTGAIAEAARDAVALLLRLEGGGLVKLLGGSDKYNLADLTELATDWTITELAKNGASISRDEAKTWVRAELVNSFEVDVDNLPTSERLTNLATQAVVFVEELRSSGQLSVSGGNIENDIATAWLLTEAAKQGLVVSSDQIAQAVTAALRQRDSEV